jgi:hypothetical protein
MPALVSGEAVLQLQVPASIMSEAPRVTKCLGDTVMVHLLSVTQKP